jgi:alanine racemase
MHRAGCDPADVLSMAKAVAAREELVLEGLMTHLAVADEPGNDFTEEQLRRFEAVRGDLRDAGLEPPMVHAANSAGALLWPAARYDMVRCGIAMYGSPPAPELAGALPGLKVAMDLTAAVSQVRRVEAGEAISYGQRYRLERPSTIAVVPVGYGDGVPRRLGHVGGEVLVAGRRYPIAGAVTMDQLMVDCGDDPVRVGDRVVLIGRDGNEEITAAELARRAGTIAYEIVTSVGARVPRVHVGATA